MARPWPAVEPTDTNSLANQVYSLQAHCHAIIQFAAENPTRKPSASDVQALAKQTLEVVNKLAKRSWEISLGIPPPQDERAEAGADNESVEISSSEASGTRRLEAWNAQVDSEGPMSTLPSSIPPSSPPASEMMDEDLQIRVRWLGPRPYKKKAPKVILDKIQAAICSSDNPVVSSVNLRAVEKLRSGDLELYTYEARDRERLVYNADVWLPRITFGKRARIVCQDCRERKSQMMT